MRLLFDENLSRSLCTRLKDVFPESKHVVAAGLERASDQDVWEYAKRNGSVIVTKDGDYHQMSFLLGAPPKVVWLRIGNCSTDKIEDLLRRNLESIAQFEGEAGSAILIIEPI